jgi:hypothetical protein
MMSVVVRYTPPSATTQQYDEANSRVSEAFGDDLPDGCDYHVAFVGPDGNVRVSEIWDSREQWEAWGQKLMPLLGDLGIDPGTPDVFEVHNIQKR